EMLGMIILKTSGDPERVLAADRVLDKLRSDWFADEVLLYQARVLRRLNLTARSFFALIEPGSCFAGSLFELALAADRNYVLDAPEQQNTIALSGMNAGPLPMSNGITRLQTRFLGEPDRVAEV